MFRTGDTASARVLIASADAVLRSALMSVLAQVEGLTVVGFIRIPEQVLQRTAVSSPDLLLLDSRLGTEAHPALLAELHSSLPNLRILVYGADAVEAPLRRRVYGDTAHSTRLCTHVPTCAHEDYRALHVALAELFPSRAATGSQSSQPATAADAATRGARKKRNRPEVLVVASSTGGPFALTTFFKMLPRAFPLPIAVAQHMPPGFTTMLAKRLNDACELEAVEGEAGMQVTPGRIIIGPGDYHLTLRGAPGRCYVALDQGQREHSCRPAANVLFRSAAQVYGGSVLTVVLTGMGRDGFEGARQLHDLGGRVVVQDAATSTVWGMPGAIAQAGFADAVLPLQEIAAEITRSL